jgi:hypothetical protein
MSIRRSVALLIAILTATAFPADGEVREGKADRKAAWDWTIEERLAKRFDPVAMRTREAEYQKVQPTAATSKGYATANGRERASISYSIDGRYHPELFLSHELFDTLITGFTPDLELRAKQRDFLREDLLKHGFDQELFWVQLESVGGEYARLHYDQTKATTKGVDIERCRSRFRALEAARFLFGRQRLDRFLYEALAPKTSFSVTTAGIDQASRLRQAEEGCF